MSKKSQPADQSGAVYHGLETMTRTLLAPIEHKGEMIAEITLTEPRAYHAAMAEDAAEKGGARASHLIRAIAGLPAEAELRARDFSAVTKWMNGLTRSALERDGVVEQAAQADEADPFAIEPGLEAAEALTREEIDAIEGEKTFDLLVPFEFGGRRIETLTASEPTVDAMLAGEKYKGQARQTMAMIAAATGEPIPVINRLALRDLQRLEAWLAPFVLDVVSASTGGA